jgi:PEGA domain-containing protein
MAFRDGLGERRVTKDAAGAAVEVLCLRRELAAVPSFEFALRERVTRLAGFRHAYYGRVRGVERSPEFDQALTIASDATQGIRLSALLDTAHEQRLPIDLEVALCLIRQLVPAVAILHETARDASHGALGPERLIVTPNGRLLIVEYVLGSALEQLLFTRERYWTELRVALPRVAGLPRFDHLADVTQVGVAALSLILGRTLRDDEYPMRIGEVLAGAVATNATGKKEALPASVRGWLQRALQLDARNSFPSAIEARAEFERALAESGCDASPERLDTFLKRYHAHQTPAAQGAASDANPTPLRVAPATVSVTQPSLAAPTPVAPPVAPAVASSAPVAAPPVMPAQVMSAAVVPLPAVPLHTLPTHEKHDLKTHDHKSHGVQLPEHNAPVSSRVTPAAEPTASTPKETPELSRPMFASNTSELPDAPLAVPARRVGGKVMKVAAASAMGVLAIAAVALVGARRFWTEVPAPLPTGTLVVTTNPDGAEAFVDGIRRGNTPIRLQLLTGSHRVELRGHGEPRVIPITIAPGQEVAQYVDLPALPPPSEVRAEPAPEPPAPVDHAAADAKATGPGWISISGKVEVQLFEGGHLLGSSKIEQIMVPSGRHDLEIVSELVGYRGTKSIQVAPGKVTTVTVDLPKGTMAINALPWAEVWMDGVKIGETPIGNFSVAVGSHDVVFRNPELGEQRETVLVTLKNSTRLSVDMRKP